MRSSLGCFVLPVIRDKGRAESPVFSSIKVPTYGDLDLPLRAPCLREL